MVVAALTVNAILVVITIVGFFVSDAGYDWLIYAEAGRRVGTPDLYEWSGGDPFNYSPVLAYGFALIGPIGYAGWSLLHLAALAGLPDRRIVVATLLSWPFWADVYNGNTMTFVFVAAVGALGGRSAGTGTYLGLTLLMPRPLMLPLVAWILWKQPAWRWRFAVMFIVHGALVWFTGHAAGWFETLSGVSDVVATSSRDIGPSALIGSWWMLIGVGLAVWLTAIGRVGAASLAASPYWLPQYLMMLLLELLPRRNRSATVPAEVGRNP